MQKAEQINQWSDELNAYIENLKQGALKEVDDPKEYEAMDKSVYFNNLFYQGGELTDTGQEFVTKIETYRDNVIGLIQEDYPDIAASVKEEFSTGGEDGKVEPGDGTKRQRLHYNFVGYPLIASLTKLTQIQSDVKTTQSEILSQMMQGQLVTAVSMSNYEAIVIPDKSAFFSGENFTGTVVLGRVDKTMNFGKVTINGQEVDPKNFSAGQVKLNVPAGNVGSQTLTGMLQFAEGDSIVKIPIKKEYEVIPKPNAAVISADKMNVVYRGVKNPMTISVPGATNVSASAPGLSHASGNNYIMDPTRVRAREINIKVTAKLPGGADFSDSKKFRIKEIPRPSGTIRGQMMEGAPLSMNKRGLSISTVSAKIPNFDFDLNLNVSGFSIKVEGERTIVVNGQQLNAAAQRVVQSAQRGSTVTIFDIKTSIAGNSSYRMPPPSPIIIELKD
jgi:gliding motility-associated protein GldM